MATPAYNYIDEARPWSDRAQLLEVVRITPEAPDVATFTFRTTSNSWFRYLPGQFVTLELPLPSGPLLRTYTLSSSPSRPLSIAVTVKAQASSTGTRWMLDSLKVGDRLKAYGPAGSFSFHLHKAPKYLFLSAGSGITPMMSMARWIEDHAEAADIAFITCARRPSDILFRAELERMATGTHPFHLAFVVEATDARNAWTGFRGRLNLPVLQATAPDFLEREVFCCGPAPFMQAVKTMLAGAGFDMRRYHEESFQPEAAEPLPELQDEAAAPAGSVFFTLSEVEASGEAGDTILQLARSAGLNIPTGCTMGLCGTCKVQRLSGETVMQHQGGILDDDVDAGFVLACCTRPVGRVEIEV
jgi:ferredoxin-NADP reductase